MNPIQNKRHPALVPHLPELSGALFLFAATLQTQALDPWQTVQDWQMVPAKDSQANDVRADSANGTLLVSGSALDLSDTRFAIFQQSSDGGLSWGGQALNIPGASATVFKALALDPANVDVLYAGGYLTANDQMSWLAMRSPDHGATWSLDETYQLQAGYAALLAGLDVDGSGNAFACGYAGTSSTRYWTTRKRDATTGTWWATVDTPTPGRSSTDFARALVCDPAGGVFVAGTYLSKWAVRRSLDGGTTWATVDSIAGDAFGIRVITDAAGGRTVYCAGRGTPPSTKGKPSGAGWMVRVSTDNGLTWSIADFVSGGSVNQAMDVCADIWGNVYVLGHSIDSAGLVHWIVRKRPAGATQWQTSDDFLPPNVSGAYTTRITSDGAGSVFAVGMYGGGVPAHWIVRKLAGQ